MTDGYDSWWHVGVAEVSEQESYAAVDFFYNSFLGQLVNVASDRVF